MEKAYCIFYGPGGCCDRLEKGNDQYATFLKVYSPLIICIFSGRCIHQTERLYSAQFEKVNNFALYNSLALLFPRLAGKVNLPNGIYGPHTIGVSTYPSLWFREHLAIT